MKKITAQTNANIALVKYWGKKNEELRLPVNSSLSITLDQVFTQTTVEFEKNLKKDLIEIDGTVFSGEESKRVIKHLDRIRKLAKIKTKARVKTKNNFPKKVGAASSASGFAALSVAGAKAAGLDLSEKKLSILARQGSGSACRSIAGGFNIWQAGTNNETSFAQTISYPEEWDLRILLVFVGKMQEKKVGSSEGMKLATTSPFYQQAVIEAEKNLAKMKQSLREKNWSEFGKIVEQECFRLHTLCLTSDPYIPYWEGTTFDIFHKLIALRGNGVDGFFTSDAGPHVHIICKAKDVARIKNELRKIAGVAKIVESCVGGKAKLLNQHLF